MAILLIYTAVSTRWSHAPVASDRGRIIFGEGRLRGLSLKLHPGSRTLLIVLTIPVSSSLLCYFDFLWNHKRYDPRLDENRWVKYVNKSWRVIVEHRNRYCPVFERKSCRRMNNFNWSTTFIKSYSFYRLKTQLDWFIFYTSVSQPFWFHDPQNG